MFIAKSIVKIFRNKYLISSQMTKYDLIFSFNRLYMSTTSYDFEKEFIDLFLLSHVSSYVRVP